MGKKNKKKSAAKRGNRNKSSKGNGNRNSSVHWNTWEETMACLEGLSVATTGTAEDHGLTGDCPLCLEPLGPFWEELTDDLPSASVLF